jgi:hypothetical protein
LFCAWLRAACSYLLNFSILDLIILLFILFRIVINIATITAFRVHVHLGSRFPSRTNHASSFAPSLEQAANSLIRHGKEVFFRVCMRLY